MKTSQDLAKVTHRGTSGTMKAFVYRITRELMQHGLMGGAGNVSIRCGDGFYLTPSAYNVAKGALPICYVTFDGVTHGSAKPSSEWRLHRDIYLAKPVTAIAHFHAPYATTLATLGKDIPPFHYMIAEFGGMTIPCAGYATFGTAELSALVIGALAERSACLMANHGAIVTGSPATVVRRTIAFEYLCRLYAQALQIGQPNLLNDEQMADVLAKFADYRHQTSP